MKLFILVQYGSGKKQYKKIVHNTNEIVATKIKEIWHKVNIPIVEHRKMLALIKECHENYQHI